MARMIATKEPTNPAERWVFEALKHGYRTSGWTVYYSYHVTDPKTKKTREIDFVVIIPEYYAVICLEVKGGSFDIKNDGMWYTSGGALLKESPHDKVTADMYVLKDNNSEFFFLKVNFQMDVWSRSGMQMNLSLPYRTI